MQVKALPFSMCALIALAAGSGAGVSARAATESYPVKPVRLIVPFAPGGGTDIVARAFAPKLSELWNQQVVVDNRGARAR